MFSTLVASKLAYAVASAWLLKTEQRRLDGFQAKCLRRILKIPPSFLSRFSKKTVLTKAGARPLSEQVAAEQQELMGKILDDQAKEDLQKVAFRCVGGNLIPTTGEGAGSNARQQSRI